MKKSKMKTQKGTAKIVIIFIIFVIILAGFYAVFSGEVDHTVKIPQTEDVSLIEQPKEVVDSIRPDVLVLLQQNNIDLSKLRSTKNTVEGDSLKVDFMYSDKKTGYTFVSTPRTTLDELGIMHAWFDVYYKSLPVFTTQLGLHFGKDEVTSNDVEFSDISVSMVPTISKIEAMKIIESEQKTLKGVNPVLGFSDKNSSTGNNTQEFTLIWKTPGKGAVVEVDAFTGEVLYSFDGLYTIQ